MEERSDHVVMRKVRSSVKDVISNDAWVMLDILCGYTHNNNTRFVGGSVRDLLLYENMQQNGHTRTDIPIAVKEIDMATTMLPDEVTDYLIRYGIRTIPTGLKHGTVSALFKKQLFEITTLRRDVLCDGRYAQVEFSSDWRDDAARRDFTINALSMDRDGDIYDYFKGYKDLKAGVIRFIGNPEERINEDYLRILRYFRFNAYIGASFKEEDLNIISKLSPNMSKLSRERIKIEMFKILTMPHVAKALHVMYSRNIFNYMHLSCIDLCDMSADNFLNLHFSKVDPLANLAAILRLSKISKSALIELANNLKFSNKEAKILMTLCIDNNGISDALALGAPTVVHEQYIYLLGYETYIHYITMLNVFDMYGQLGKLVSNAQKYIKRTMPLNGRDLLALGLREGSHVGKYLKIAEEQWIASGFQLTKSQLLKEIVHIMASS